MNEDNPIDEFEEHHEILHSIRSTRIVIPILIGVAVIVFLVFRQLNLTELYGIKWTPSTALWLLISIAAYSLRHLMYSYRLKILSEGSFSWLKSIELITILEFASAVSPTNFGGSAVAFFMLIQENISGAKATAIVIYTIVADTLFFVFSIPLLYFSFGTNIFFPVAVGHEMWKGMELTLLIVWLVMSFYGLLLVYGLFVRPLHIRRLLETLSRWRIFGRSRDKIAKAAQDIEQSSREIRYQPWSFHAKVGGATLISWIVRFFCVSAILIALNPAMSQSLYDHIILLGRGEALYTISAYSPTPGGSGVAEIIFGQFYSEYIPKGIAVVAAVLWRLITYYPYLFLGVIIIPNWIRKLIKKRNISTS
jgi:glycosyltransferase 2 family protein